MKMYRYHITTVACALGFSLLLTACGPKETAQTTSGSDENILNYIQILDTKPASALSVKEARQNLKPGDEVVVYGQIGGVDEPFLEGYAGFVLADTEVVFCNEMGDDHCTTPWDACCEDTDKLRISRASVQFIDEQGQPLRSSMKGFVGLRGLSKITVVGTVDESSTMDNLIISAYALYKEQD